MRAALCTLALFGLVTGAVLSGAPQHALAQDENVQPSEISDVSTAEELDGALEKAGGQYEVGTADELAQAFTDIAASSETEVTIVLTANINNSSNKVVGVEGKRITFQSAGDARYSLYATSLVGDCIFDNVDLSNNDIAAMGHYLELTENFTDSLGTIYGGKAWSKTATTFESCTLVLRGGSSSTVYGVGSNCGTTGDVSVTIDGHETSSLIGGAQIYEDRAEDARIKGDIAVTVLSGAVDDLTGGSVGRSGTVGNTPVLALVDGTVKITIGADGSPDETAVVGDVWGGGKYARCKAVELTVDDGAYVGFDDGGAFFVMVAVGGDACTVDETVSTVVNGGEVAVLYAAGIGEFQQYGDRYDIPMLIGDPSVSGNPEDMPNAVSLYINDGYVNTVAMYAYAFNAINDDDLSQIYGNSYVEMNGGRVVQFQLSYMYSLTHGDSTLRVFDGRVTYASAVWGDKFGHALDEIDDYVLGDTNVIFDGCGTQSNNIEEAVLKGWKQIRSVDNVILTNSAQVSGETACLLSGIGNLRLDNNCTLGLLGGQNSSGDLVQNTVVYDASFAEGSALAMCRNEDEDAGMAAPALLSVAGTVKGAADLYTVDPVDWGDSDQSNNKVTLSIPENGEVYVRAGATVDESATSGSKSTQFTWANDLRLPKPYVEYTTEDALLDDTYEHAWRIYNDDEPVAASITIKVQDMVAYTGGDSLEGSTFPAIRYQVTATDANGDPSPIDLSSMTFMTPDGEEHHLPVGTKSGDILPIEWMPTTIYLSDESEMNQVETGVITNDVVAGDYVVEPDANSIVISADGYSLAPAFASGTITIRDVSEPEAVVAGEKDVAQPVVSDAAQVDTSDGIGIAVIAEGTHFFTNGREELGLLGNGEDDAQISLLFDELLPGDGTEDTADYLRERAATDGHALTEENSEFRYLDLVNENDGNAWVSTEDGAQIEIWWPVPEGVDPEEVEFSVLHFQGLHRQYRDNLADQIASCKIEVIGARVEGDNVVFTLTGDQDEGCFSPFALTWSEKEAENPSEGEDPEEPETPEDPETPEQPGDDEKPEQPSDDNNDNDQQNPAGDKNDQVDKNDGPSGSDDIPDTGDAALVAAPALLAGCAAVATAACLARRRS